MKLKLLSFIFASLLILIRFVPPASAHLAGQPPFFKINGVYSDFYHVNSTSLSDFELPQDAAPATYIVNQPIQFELDTEKLPVPQDIIKKSTFTWEYGDGGKATGLTNTHSYTKIGSYLLKIWVNDGTMPEAQLLQTVLLHILPDPNYQLPKSVIIVNGKASPDPIKDVLEFNLKSNLQFDGSRSVAPSSKIVSYFWDLGDGATSTEKTVVHSYHKDLNIVYPFLRIKDANGFIADSYVELDNNTNLPEDKSMPVNTSATRELPIGIKVGGALLIFAILGLGFRVLKKK